MNLPVADLNRSVQFFTKLGFTFNPKFTDENATCMVVGDDASVMLLVESFFGSFTNRKVADATTAIETILAVSAVSRAEVDEFADTALAAGASKANDPMDYGFMYGRSFHDLDGHLWEIVHMDESAMPQ